MGAILSQTQGADRLKSTIDTLLNAGQVTQAEPLIRQYLEYRLQQIIRKVDIRVSIDFAMKDHSQMVQNCIDAITDRSHASTEGQYPSYSMPKQIHDFDTVHVPAIVGNWVSHYATGSASSFSAPMLKSVVTTVDALSECFRFDHISAGQTTRRWYKSLSVRI